MASKKTEPTQSVVIQLNGIMRAGSKLIGGFLTVSVDYQAQKIVGLIHQDEYEVEISDDATDLLYRA